MIAIGRQYGIRVDTSPGWWVSFGVHFHAWPPRTAHFDPHILWWLFTFGRHYAGPRKDREEKPMEYAPIPYDPIPAEIIETPTEENGYFYRVHTCIGDAHFLCGLGTPQDGHVGQRGTIQYKAGACSGQYFWALEEDCDAASR